MDRKEKQGFTFIEVMVAILLLGTLVGLIGAMDFFIVKFQSQVAYEYTALNLAREILEFGEGTEYSYIKSVTTCWPNRTPCGGGLNLSTPCGQCCCSKECERAYSYQMIYKYNPKKDRYEFDPRKDFKWLDRKIIDARCSPYAGSDYYDYTREGSIDTIYSYNPFTVIGDIKEKKMVPKTKPNRVKIIYTVKAENYDFRKHQVVVEWEGMDGNKKSITLGTYPLNRVNDTFKLKISNFWWD